MNDKDPADRLLNDIVERIQNTSIPEYPGPSLLDLTKMRHSLLPEADRSKQNSHAAALAIVCCAVVLCSAAVLVAPRQRPGRATHVTEITDENVNLNVGPVKIVEVDIIPELDRMLARLDRLAGQLDQLESDVALREIQSVAATVLAEFTPQQIDVR